MLYTRCFQSPPRLGRRHSTLYVAFCAAQGDVVGLKGDVARALRELGEAPAREGSAVAALAELERVKARMEAACSTLKARHLLGLWCLGCSGQAACESGRHPLHASGGHIARLYCGLFTGEISSFCSSTRVQCMRSKRGQH